MRVKCLMDENNVRFDVVCVLLYTTRDDINNNNNNIKKRRGIKPFFFCFLKRSYIGKRVYTYIRLPSI